MKRIRILEEAAEEAIEAAAWNEAQRRGLGEEFSRAVEDALDLLQDDVIPLLSILTPTTNAQSASCCAAFPTMSWWSASEIKSQ